jgi:ABC-type sugar transport system ATPase subunit
LESTTLLQAEGLSKSFGELKALQDVDLEVKTGSIHALLGHTASGKSTLMNVFCGVCLPDAGRLLLNGKVVNFRSPEDALREGIAMVHQGSAVVSDLAVSKNIFLGQEPTVKFDSAAGHAL